VYKSFCFAPNLHDGAGNDGDRRLHRTHSATLEATLRPKGAPRMMGRRGVVQNRYSAHSRRRTRGLTANGQYIGNIIDWLVARSYPQVPGSRKQSIFLKLNQEKG
jgi:hypothetical protein